MKRRLVNPLRCLLSQHQKKTKEETMEFVVLGKYTAAGLGGFAKNPNEDRKAVIGAMMDSA